MVDSSKPLELPGHPPIFRGQHFPGDCADPRPQQSRCLGGAAPGHARPGGGRLCLGPQGALGGWRPRTWVKMHGISHGILKRPSFFLAFLGIF